MSSAGAERLARIVGWSSCGSASLDVAPFLKDRKSIKLMAKQDCLALSAAARAVQQAELTSRELGSETGIYLTVGALPFEEAHLHTLADNSTIGGRFEMRRFSTDGLASTNPILTFKCLPNMPVFHMSYNLGIRGPYFVTYPGPSQFFSALEQALVDLEAGRVRFALVGAVADQENFLVRHHIRRLGASAPESLRDGACVMVVTLDPRRKALARIGELALAYSPADPFSPPRAGESPADPSPGEHGPVGPLLAMQKAAESLPKRLTFRYEDGVEAAIALERESE